MKCPKCDITLPDNTEVCPLCHTPVKAGLEEKPVPQNTGRFSAIDPSKDTYDFDLQYTLTFKDAGEIRQAIADMDLSKVNKDRSEELLHPERARNNADKPEHRVRTQAEMEEAMHRAELRREQRNSKGGKKHIGEKRSHIERMSRRDKETAAALRAAKARSSRPGQDEKKKRALAAGVGVAVVVIAIIIGAIKLFAGVMDGDTLYPTVYTKGNQLYMVYDKKPQLLSENLISVYESAPAQGETSSSSSSSKNSNSQKVEDPKVYKQAVPTEKQLVSVSQDGLYTYFFENVNVNNGRGDLVYYQNDSPKSRTVVASSVYYKIKVSNDGKSVLYLKNTDDTGYHGELCYWNPTLKESLSIEQDICSDNFVLAQNGLSVLYIKNFNPIVNTGDLCLSNISKDGISSSVIDDNTAFVFGTTPKGDVYLYAKDYDTKKGTYGLYGKKNNESAKQYAKDAFLPPVILEKSEAVYAYSDYHDNFQNISYVNLENGQANVIAEDVTEINRVRVDEGAVIYTKTYETDKSDYYVVENTANASQKIANAVAVNTGGTVQFDAADDFSRVAYISGYDKDSCQGALFTLSINMGYVGTEKRISDAAYSCDVSSNGAVVRFATNYNKEAATVSLVTYVNSNTVTLAEEVSAGAFTYDKAGETMVYASNVTTDPVVSGDIKSVNNKGKIRKIAEGMSSYGLKKDGVILLLRKDEGSDSGKLYYTNRKGKKAKLMDEGVTKALLY